MDVLTLGRAAFALGALSLVACKPDLDQRATTITGVRVLAVRAEPAEVEPRDPVTFTALVVDGEGAAAPTPWWAFCNARKPLAELGPVNPTCVDPTSEDLARIAVGDQAAGTMPPNACKDFGPEVPTAKAGEPYGRPVDPDPTGGYYQPVSLFVDGHAAVATTRVSCGVAGASSEDVVTFRQRYHVNENPAIAAITVDGTPAPDDPTVPVVVAPGAHVAVSASWPACPVTDACGDGICGADESRVDCVADCGRAKGCAGAERYVAFDRDARALVVRREEMRVSWFSTAGLFDRDRTGRGAEDLATSSDDVWVAPDAPGAARAWIVLRDDRGGVAWRELRFEVR